LSGNIRTEPSPREGDLATTVPGRAEFGLAIGIALFALGTLALVAPLSRVPLPHVPAFVPAYESALAVSDLITSVILLAHFSRARSAAVLIVACGFFFDAVVIVPHILTFPGAFGAQGLLGAGSQTTAWLYCFWHGGFALYVLAFALLRRIAPDLHIEDDGQPILLSLIATIMLVVALTLVATVGESYLPTIFMNGDYSQLVTKGVSPAICALCAVALALLWPRRRAGVLDLWMIVVITAWLCDVVLSSVVGASRFDLGWYAGRTFGLMATVALLVLLLVEFSRLDEKLLSRTAQLRASEALRHTFFEYSSECFSVLERTDGGPFRYAEMNAATLALYGKTREQVLGRTTAEVLGAAAAKTVDAHLASCLRSRRPERYERAQGQRTIEALATPVPDGETRTERVIVSARDITERLLLEEQLRQSQKMEAIGQLTGGIAHDFNNMLAIVMGSLDMARRRIASGSFDGLQKWLDNASEGATRAATLTSRLLSYSRRQPLDPKVLDANGLVSATSQLLRQIISETVEIETVLSGGLWRVFADPSQIENCLVNLAVNARDAMPDGGKITIETRNADLDERYARVHVDVKPGQYVMMSITDTGSGMPPEILERAFEPFFSTKERGKGTGLGLSQIFGFAKQSNGHVTIYSEVGHGTTVRLYLPRYFGAAASDPVFTAPNASLAHGEVILVVEDEPAVRRISVQALEELGYRTLSADDPAHALQLLADDPEVVLLFTDIVMPGMTGRQLADRARAARPDLKVLYTTGYSRNAIVHNGVLDHGAFFLPKPFTVEELATKVSQLLSG
jgi:PAS domain S-box-containing protein